MDWGDLRHFLAAVRAGSLAGAARELGCDYTTVGRRIAALESALSTTLFIRTPDGLTPTDAANELVPLAAQMESAAAEIALRASGHDQRVEGVVRITCAEGFSTYVTDRLADLRASHPQLVVEVIADIRLLDLTRGEADLALRMSPTTQRDLVVRTLCDLPWRMFAAEAYVARRGVPTPIEDLHRHDVVGYDSSLAHLPGAAWLAAHGANATVTFRGNSLRAILDAVGAGLGLSVLPHFFARRDPRLQPLAPDILGTRTLSVVVHPELRKVARVRVVMDWLVAAIQRDHAAGVFGIEPT